MPRFYALVLIFTLALVTWGRRASSLTEVTHPASIFQAALVPEKGLPTALEGERLAVWEVLAELVDREHEYRATHGNFTAHLEQLSVPVPEFVRSGYDFTIESSARDHLLIRALSRPSKNALTIFSINQAYQMSANFPIRVPRHPIDQSLVSRSAESAGVHREPSSSAPLVIEPIASGD